MLVCGGMIKVATMVFSSAGSSSERRRFPGGWNFYSVVFWCLMRPCLERSFKSSVSLLVVIPSWSDSSFILCHDPFLMAVKNLSMLKVIVQSGYATTF